MTQRSEAAAQCAGDKSEGNDGSADDGSGVDGVSAALANGWTVGPPIRERTTEFIETMVAEGGR